MDQIRQLPFIFVWYEGENDTAIARSLVGRLVALHPEYHYYIERLGNTLGDTATACLPEPIAEDIPRCSAALVIVSTDSAVNELGRVPPRPHLELQYLAEHCKLCIPLLVSGDRVLLHVAAEPQWRTERLRSNRMLRRLLSSAGRETPLNVDAAATAIAALLPTPLEAAWRGIDDQPYGLCSLSFEAQSLISSIGHVTWSRRFVVGRWHGLLQRLWVMLTSGRDDAEREREQVWGARAVGFRVTRESAPDEFCLVVIRAMFDAYHIRFRVTGFGTVVALDGEPLIESESFHDFLGFVLDRLGVPRTMNVVAYDPYGAEYVCCRKTPTRRSTADWWSRL